MVNAPVLVYEQVKSVPLEPEEFVEALLALPDEGVQRQFLAEHLPTLDADAQDEVADLLKVKSDHFLRSDIQRCLNSADLILHIADLTTSPWHRALGLRAMGNALCYGGLGEYRRAVELYDEAVDIYRVQGHVVHEAGTQYAKLTALAHLGRYDEALQIGEWAGRVLEKNAKWLLLAKLNVNLGSIHRRLGQDALALTLYNRARDLYRQFENDYEATVAIGRVEQNRSVVLRNLGLFEEAIQASQTAWGILGNTGQKVEAARAKQNLALTYFVLGRYNEALALLDRARDVFLDDGRQRDAVLIELFVSDCLLQLRRFKDVLDKSRQARTLFAQLGTQFEVAQSILNEAVAYAGLERYDEALAALEEARRLFVADGNSSVWVASTDLEIASILLRQEKHQESIERSLACAEVFAFHRLPVERSQALLVAARAAVQSGQYEQVRDLVAAVLTVAEDQDIPTLVYQAHYLLGAQAEAQGNLQQARAEYERAATVLERMRGRLMIEFRADFLEDKQVVYEDLVQVCLDLDEPQEGLMYAERAKSRALLELLAFRLNLGIEARAEADQPLVEELVRLRGERDRLYRRWQGDEVMHERGETTIIGENQHVAQQDVVVLEQQITELWHRLLIRNADYARDAALWQVRVEPVQPFLDAETALVEYFLAQGQFIVFFVTRETVQARRLPVKLPQIQHLLQLLWLNLRAVPKSSPEQVVHLTANARGILRRFYDHLVAPLTDLVASYQKLVIVPHGPLHYLPFHALQDETGIFVSRHEISYLPSASFLRYWPEPRQRRGDLIAVGHSYGGRLPYTNQEARTIASLSKGLVLLEDEATLAQVQAAAAQCDVLHLAAHADFRPDSPLFSGLALADGWLTTLDIFNLRLQASLVTLSACQTGRSVVSGGDELLGLMRAFLSAGAASLVLSLWAVEDYSTALLMEKFYSRLTQGWTKGAALRNVQTQFARGRSTEDTRAAKLYTHPYFWAPFYLVGNAGLL